MSQPTSGSTEVRAASWRVRFGSAGISGSKKTLLTNASWGSANAWSVGG